MQVLNIILTIVLILISVALTVIVLFQEGKSAGLGALSGQATDNSYWAKNKGRSKEGMMIKATTVMVVLFFIISILLNMKFLQ